MKILVCGDRNWTDRKPIRKALLSISDLDVIDVVIEGGANGADTLAREVGKELGIIVWEFKADWRKYGRAAGPIRNRQMLDEKPDRVLAFHDDLEESKGTKDTVTEARRRGIPVTVIGH